MSRLLHNTIDCRGHEPGDQANWYVYQERLRLWIHYRASQP